MNNMNKTEAMAGEKTIQHQSDFTRIFEELKLEVSNMYDNRYVLLNIVDHIKPMETEKKITVPDELSPNCLVDALQCEILKIQRVNQEMTEMLRHLERVIR